MANFCDDFGAPFESQLEHDLDDILGGSRTYIMYHGTTLTAALNIMEHGFQQSSGGMLGPGVYVSRSFQKAQAYPRNLPFYEQKAVLKLRVQVGKVKKIDYQGHPLQKTWHQHGYDTAWVPPNCGMVPSGLEEDCVWDPSRIEVLDIIRSEHYTGAQFRLCSFNK
uniref:PARP catalytic domain-containing protein n=1 Tax=Paramormyrops kingsleyae TaxID=1676925 RepID=A0A3B3R6X8_9TELE